MKNEYASPITYH